MAAGGLFLIWMMLLSRSWMKTRRIYRPPGNKTELLTISLLISSYSILSYLTCISSHLTLQYVMLRCVILFSIILSFSYLVVHKCILSCHISSHLIYNIVSYRIVSCHIISYHITSYHISYHISCCVMSYLISSYLTFSYQIIQSVCIFVNLCIRLFMRHWLMVPR